MLSSLCVFSLRELERAGFSPDESHSNPNLLDLKSKIKNGSVLAVGKFQSFHSGHVAILEEVLKTSKEMNLPPVILTFPNSPNYYFNKLEFNKPLLGLRARKKYLLNFFSEFGIVPIVVFQKFDRWFSSMTPKDFVESVVLKTLNARHLVIGEDFRFGQRQAGDVRLLKEMGAENSFGVTPVKVFPLRGSDEKLSTTAVKRQLQKGDLASALKILTNYRIVTRVVKGKGMAGSVLQCPTINSKMLGNVFAPKHGVYQTRLKIMHDKCPSRLFKAVTNIGVRPTIHSNNELVFETHVLDWEFGDELELTGIIAEIELLSFVRSEEKFASLDELKSKIHNDVARTRELF